MSPRLLFVDDMADMGELIVDLLRLEGVEVDWCQRGAEAAERLASGRYGALVTDLSLGGGVDGEALAAQARGLDVPTLVISGDALAIERLRGEGVDALLKPVEIERMLRWLGEQSPPREQSPPAPAGSSVDPG